MNWRVEIEDVAGKTAIDRAADATTGVGEESVTRTVKLELPCALGRPCDGPARRKRQPGRQ